MPVQIAEVVFILIPLIVILLGCELFTNGIEWLGLRLGLAERCTGSVLAAVGTALPETIVPIVAIIFVADTGGHEIAQGAILGAPFMLATLAMFVGGATVLTAHKLRGRSPRLLISAEHIQMDIRYFLMMYSLAILAALFLAGASPGAEGVRYLIAILLIVLYANYLRKMLLSPAKKCDVPESLYFVRPFHSLNGRPPSVPMVALQVFASLGMIIVGARLFVSDIEHIASELGISTIILAFLIAPLATELPEKFNSVLWYWRSKDTLALGNVTGAMVFQSSIPVSIGIVFTDWILEPINIASMAFAMTAIALIYLELRHFRGLSYATLMFSGIFYFLYLSIVLFF